MQTSETVFNLLFDLVSFFSIQILIAVKYTSSRGEKDKQKTRTQREKLINAFTPLNDLGNRHCFRKLCSAAPFFFGSALKYRDLILMPQII